MQQFWSTSAKILGFQSSRPKAMHPHVCFPKFSELPAELRDQIWAHSLEQRVIPLHIRQYIHRQSDIEFMSHEEFEEYEDQAVFDTHGEDDEEGDSLNEINEDEGSENDDDIDPAYSHFTMAILTCSMGARCQCTYKPPSSIHTVPPPAAFSVCRESREATRHLYSRYLEAEYNIHGHPADGSNGIRLAMTFKPSEQDIKSQGYPFPYRTGVFINPAVDALMINMDIASTVCIQESHHFASVMSKQLPNITRVVINTVIALRPFMWWKKERFQYWRTMGASADWVPKQVTKFPHLKDVVVLLGGKTHEQMLPVEWRERTARIWREEVEKMRERWPEQWVHGGAPVLKVVARLEDM